MGEHSLSSCTEEAKLPHTPSQPFLHNGHHTGIYQSQVNNCCLKILKKIEYVAWARGWRKECVVGTKKVSGFLNQRPKYFNISG